MKISSTYNLSPDNYISLHIANLNCASTLVNGKLCTFKIPVSTILNILSKFTSITDSVDTQLSNDIDKLKKIENCLQIQNY